MCWEELLCARARMRACVDCFEAFLNALSFCAENKINHANTSRRLPFMRRNCYLFFPSGREEMR